MDGFYELPKNENHEYIFIIDPFLEVYIATKIRGELHHTSMSHGRPIPGGGVLKKDDNGYIHILTDWSGHYQFKPDVMVTILKVLKSKGIDISKIPNIVCLNKYIKPEVEIGSVSLNETGSPPIEEWMVARKKASLYISVMKKLLKMKYEIFSRSCPGKRVAILERIQNILTQVAQKEIKIDRTDAVWYARITKMQAQKSTRRDEDVLGTALR